ncbi:hypothetical protein C6341_g17039 [Phytophthora cactorum]|nr:hypothetical protein C6341_g17039 [Phytophthora cactorum]
MSEDDEELLDWVLEFNKFDLYTKADVRPDVEKLWPYYQALIDKYLPGKLSCLSTTNIRSNLDDKRQQFEKWIVSEYIGTVASEAIAAAECDDAQGDLTEANLMEQDVLNAALGTMSAPWELPDADQSTRSRNVNNLDELSCRSLR